MYLIVSSNIILWASQPTLMGLWFSVVIMISYGNICVVKLRLVSSGKPIHYAVHVQSLLYNMCSTMAQMSSLHEDQAAIRELSSDTAAIAISMHWVFNVPNELDLSNYPDPVIDSQTLLDPQTRLFLPIDDHIHMYLFGQTKANWVSVKTVTVIPSTLHTHTHCTELHVQYVCVW